MSRNSENRKDFTRMVCEGPAGQRLWHHLRPLVRGASNRKKLKVPQAESVVVEVDEWASTATVDQIETFLAKPDHDWASTLNSMMPQMDPAARHRLTNDQVRSLVVLAIREAMAEHDYPEEEQAALVMKYLSRSYHQRPERRPPKPRIDVDSVVVVRRPPHKSRRGQEEP